MILFFIIWLALAGINYMFCLVARIYSDNHAKEDVLLTWIFTILGPIGTIILTIAAVQFIIENHK